MQEFLKDTNPAQIWLGERFKVMLKCVTGMDILVRFDADTTYRFDAEKVLAQFGHCILGVTAPAQEVAQAIAEKINGEIDWTIETARWHAESSFIILDALSAGYIEAASARLIKLCDSLKYFGEFADRIWGKWTLHTANWINFLRMTETRRKPL